ncbi:hypothetical protein BKA70DRAFT_1242105 [Coprinopsis sp. MPI-PUGE-AT-0042]|nr:hypothetical protein BKA70DRAFT_1242105 [Coprinopsis sp. MPI-PUGE-AT-0042]
MAFKKGKFQQQREHFNKVSEHATLCEHYVKWAAKDAKKKQQSEKGGLALIKDIQKRLYERPIYAYFFDHELVNVPVEPSDNERVARPKRLFLPSLLAVDGGTQIPAPNIFPVASLGEIVLMEEFCILLEDNTAVNKADILTSCAGPLKVFFDRRRKLKEEGLLALVRNSSVYSTVGAKEVNRDTLLLASTAFLCRMCARPTSIPASSPGCRRHGDATMEAFTSLRQSICLSMTSPPISLTLLLSHKVPPNTLMVSWHVEPSH